MKSIKIYITIFTIASILFSCEDPLDRTAVGIFSEENVWKDEGLTDLFVANVFARTNFLPGAGNGDVGALVVDACAGGYCRTFGGWPTGYQFTRGAFSSQGTGNGSNEYWKWDLVRDINTGIEELSKTTNTLSTEYKDIRLGELHFLRAWVYFQKVKRYGGVPIIQNAQSLELSFDEISVPRNSEQEVYDFIAAECDAAEALLEGKDLEYGRPTSWAVLALKSRAMMYAGSVGEFGNMQLDGLLGINNADKYWQLSYDASKKIIEQGGFALYGTGAASFEEAEKSYYELFTKAEQNNETIMAEVFIGEGSKSEDWERWNAPAVVSGTTFLNTYLETFEMYEYTDGSSGKLDRTTLVPGVFHDMADFIGKKDPRCRANIFLPESSYGGQTVWMHEGLYVNGELKTANVDGIDVPAKGPARDIERTGFFNKKRSNEEYLVGPGFELGGTDYMVFRLGEMYLNLAEAAFALEKDAEALEALNTVRRRVNMPDKPAISWEVIQSERAVELAFEQHRYWDLRRWRIAHLELDRRGNKYSGVRWRKDYDNPGMYEIIHTTTGTATDSWDRIFEDHHYYFPIGLDRIQRSPALIENPGYE
ncbi:RagB/SusD family nutrient uptake outer membrane protein [Flavicella sediminum]|uniref:RagB/SusD family nutrient uptake outer membrane protein n=1 Tax=Flavicella sediminum TaxID=2585141 RepID=UPI0011227A87|nr:RagB/SusD family nutrient uptake outer membrane protein [Flavicella sediminum]